MSRLAILVAAFAMLLVAVTATKSTITTVEVDNESLNQQWGGGGRCRQQIQMTGGLNHCRMFLMDQARCTGGSGSRGSPWGGRGSQWGSRCQYGECDDNQYGMRGKGSACPSMHFEPCYDQLRQLNQQYRCEGLREVMMRQLRGRFSGGQEMEEVPMVASNLPQMCGFRHQFCQISRRNYAD